ncbi:sensor domain-containing phosphodiesterase [Buttiauxella sp. WJP83]|uniref:sensor domain-containing phosphodiesterase n=1 Tax=Buttiauxella sp. WJP83 TaxID=2986951 RepID=UPI0022DD6D53|nr:EAL domain-containing protein [Buttiauxella sp. WJP83]WBM71693.1 sensor domain-containing phosphodiesterase [Buttiauxella sp. WJP83]
MYLASWYKKSKDKWWALPLVLPSILLPIAMWCNAQTVMDGGRVFLVYMPLGLMTALMLVFAWSALPGIILALLIYFIPLRGEFAPLMAVIHFLIPITISWGGYHIFVPRRSSIMFGAITLTAQRMVWLVLVNSLIFVAIYQLGVFFGWYADAGSSSVESLLHARTLINFQAVLIGCLTGMPFFYTVIRMCRNPRFAFSFVSRMKAQMQTGVTKTEMALWAALVVLLISLLLVPNNGASTIFTTDYTLTLILPLMLWGAMRFGFLFITTSWTIILTILCSGFYNYLPPYMGFQLHLAIASSCYAVFSMTIYLMAVVTTRQRFLHRKARRVAFIDPIVQMANLRALNRDLSRHPWSALAFLRVPELELLGRNYGVQLRIQYKQQLNDYLQPFLTDNEDVYHLSGHELAVRVNYDSYHERIESLDQHVKQFRFMWDGMAMQPQVGISYCHVRQPVTHIYYLLGELSTMADLSLSTSKPESLQQQGSNHLQNAVRNKVVMMNRLQAAIDTGNFVLMVQRIEGVRGDTYHEILLRMKGDNEGDNLFMPDAFLSVAHEFGLSSKIDKWVLEATLTFMDNHREQLPGSRFSINLTPASVGRLQFAGEVKRLLKCYNIEPWQLIFEITESNALTNIEQVNATLTALQNMGCRVAIDDFGTGYASYARLKDISADILKIDGSFIRNMLTSSLDYQIVDSICQLARIKKMQLVAEYVESEQVKAAVQSLGIDYIQGYLVGHPRPLESLLTQKVET